MNATKSTDDIPALIAVGAAVAITASLTHEALGHGVGCLADGGTVTLLTFLVFRCAGAGVLTDGGGPVGVFMVAAFCLILVRRLRPPPSVASLFGYALGVQAMLWVCAQMVREGIDGGDDWGHVAADLAWVPAWHVAVITSGVIGYAVTIRIAARLGVFLARGRSTRLLVPYMSACLFATVFGALWHGDPAASALDGFLSFGMAPLGYLLAIRAVGRITHAPSLPPVERSYAWLMSVVVIAVIFALTIAKGVGRLA